MATQLANRPQGGSIANRQEDRPTNPLVQFAGQLETRANEFKKALPSHISPDKFQRTIMTAVQADPDLLTADRQSLVLACMKAAQDGLLPDKREAALVIFTESKNIGGEWIKKKLVQYMPMVYGLRKKILQSGEVGDITAKVVYRREVEDGHFIYEEGTDAMLRHKPILDLTEEEASDGNIVAAYSMATYKDGTKSYEVMRRFEITKVQNVSQTGALIDRKGQPRTPKGPWVDWYPEQAKKTVMRRHSKTLPMSGDLIDVEGNELDSTRSAVGLLDVHPGGEPERIAIPAREELIDTETGEVINADNRTEQEIAEELDRETEAQREGRTDEQHGDQHPGDEPEAYQELVDGLIGRVINAEVMGDIISAATEFDKHRKALPDNVCKLFDGKVAASKKALGK
jgi:recombination protein RecT